MRRRRQQEIGAKALVGAVARVKFAVMSEAEIDWYATSGEPDDKAGAYAIQGLAARFIERIEGSYSNVVGLPNRMLKRFAF